MPLQPWLGIEPTEELRALYDQIANFIDRLDALSALHNCQPNLRSRLGFDILPLVAFPMLWQLAEGDAVDRRRTALSGPLYTSNDFPWPRLSTYAAGKRIEAAGFCEPLFQIETSLISQVSGFDFGDSLIQVWMDDQNAIVRSIPGKIVRDISPSAISEDIRTFFSMGEPDDRNTYREWPEGENSAPWLSSGYAFAGLGRPFHEYPDLIDHFLDNLGGFGIPTNVVTDDAKAEALSLGYRLLALDGVEIKTAMPVVAKSTSNDWIASGSLFGRFRSVQEESSDIFVDDLALPIMDVGNHDPLFWWNYGDAQLLVPADEPFSIMAFEWSTS